MKIHSLAVLFVAATLPSSSTSFQPRHNLLTSKYRAAYLSVPLRSATTEQETEAATEDEGKVIAKDEPTKSMTERMMAKAPTEGQ